MKVSTFNLQGAICLRLDVFGVPKVWHKSFATAVERWVRCSGVEWTVKRLKSLKVDLYRDRSGLALLTPAAKNRKGSFSGVIGSLFRYARHSETCFRAVSNALMCYTLFKNQKLTDSQVSKFVAAVSADTKSYPEGFLERFSAFIRKFQNKSIMIGDPTPIILHRGADGKKAPLPNRRSTIQNGAGLSSLAYFATDAHFELWQKYRSIYGKVTEGVDIQTFKSSIRSSDIPNNDIVLGGEVHFLQEPGLKLRAIASPFLVHQEALRPLGNVLYSAMRTLPWDCTHDHTKPFSCVQSHLSQHKKIHSVDLSNATDYFPLDVQLQALVGLIGNHPSIDLFEEISRSQWLSTIGTIRWNQGQPLGLYPSFASFGLTHGFLLLFLLGKRYENEFFVLGDDVIILDDSLYDKYIETLGYLGCPFSPDKSLSSSELCEFAGKIITSTCVHNTYKWREVSNDNFLDLVRNYGRKAVSLLSPIQRKVVDRVAHLCAPFGLNWSFEGSNLEVMTRLTAEVHKPVDRDDQSLTELYSTFSRNWYSVPNFKETMLPSLLKWSVDMDYLHEKISTFDEKVVATLQQVFPEEWVSAIVENSLLGGYAGVPRAVGLTNLPLAQEIPSRVSTLDRYRRLLDIK
jgi:hypothetical protein